MPHPQEAEQRQKILVELQDRLQGRWMRRVKDEQKRTWLEHIRDFQAPAKTPTYEELPPQVLRSLQARDSSGELMIGVYPSKERKLGRVAMAFSDALSELEMPEGLRGPTGETVIFAEILTLVTREGPWIVGLTFLGVLFLVLLDRRALGQTFWILFPLVAGLLLTIGMMVALGFKLNFFNMVVLPALLGMGVDHGVHYYRRWLELDGDTKATQQELFEPLSSASLTTGMGYAGLLLAHHQGTAIHWEPGGVGFVLLLAHGAVPLAGSVAIAGENDPGAISPQCDSTPACARVVPRFGGSERRLICSRFSSHRPFEGRRIASSLEERFLCIPPFRRASPPGLLCSEVCFVIAL